MKNIIIVLVSCLIIYACNSSNKTKSTADYSKKNNTHQNTEISGSIERGSQVYNSLCVTCHMPNGKGVPKSFPPLANSDYLLNNRIESIKAIKYGLSGEIKVNGEIYNMPMAAFGLSDVEIADVMNYITNSWGNKNSSLITEKEVSKITP